MWLFLGGTSWTALRSVHGSLSATPNLRIPPWFRYYLSIDLGLFFNGKPIRAAFFSLSKFFLTSVDTDHRNDMLLWVYGYGFQYPKYAVYDLYF